MSTLRKLNDKLYLNLQLSDGSASMPKRVFVDLRDEIGTLIKPRFEILHAGEGEFRESTETMPAVDMASASYFVYENDGVTLDTAYAVGKDVFMRDYSAEIIDLNLDARVSTIGGGNTNFAAAIIDGSIDSVASVEASIEEENLITTIEQDEILVGEIQEDEDVC